MTYQPRSRFVQRLPLLILVGQFLRLRKKQIKIRGNPDSLAVSVHAYFRTQSGKPNRETDVQPTAIFLPAFGGHTVGVEEDVCLA